MTETQRRIELIRELLCTYRDVLELAKSGQGSPSAEGAWGHSLPEIYRAGDYRKLEGYLCGLRKLYPRLYWHLSERYLRSSVSRRLMRAEGSRWRGLRKNEAVLASTQALEGSVRRYWVRLECWHPNVDLDRVELALAILERGWKGPVRVPLWEKEAA